MVLDYLKARMSHNNNVLNCILKLTEAEKIKKQKTLPAVGRRINDDVQIMMHDG